jgi:hypothetical protein
MNQPKSEHLAPREADRLRRAESRWLDDARERLRHTPRSTAPAPPAPNTPNTRPEPVTSEETER